MTNFAHHARTTTAAIACCLILAPVASGQAKDTSTAGAQNPAPINTIEIFAGYLVNYTGFGARNESYYSIHYKGSLVRKEGTPQKALGHPDLAALTQAPKTTEGKGDRERFSARFENGSTEVGGGLIEAAGVRPLSLRGLNALGLRGTALVTSDNDFTNVNFAAGLESKPIRILGFLHSEVTNWLVVGVNAQRQEAPDDTTGDINAGLFTWRAFVGKALGWRKSANPGTVATEIYKSIMKQAPTIEDARLLAAKIRKIPANARTSEQQLLLDAIADMTSDEDWRAKADAMARGQAMAQTDQATLAMYAETSGWYDYDKALPGSKAKNLTTVTLDYWPLTNRDDVFLRARYENGFERAAPGARKDRLLLSLAFRF